MKIALIGYGRMGREIEKAAVARHHTIVAVFNKDRPIQTAADLETADVCIDFSLPEAVPKTTPLVAAAGKPLVIGTTGWYEHIPTFQKLTAAHSFGLIYAPNFSLGVNLFFELTAYAAKLFNRFDGYDPYINEWHHRLKADSPSGTALELGKILTAQIDRKTEIVTGNLQGKISTEQLHIASIRSGAIPGTHAVGFDAEADSIILTHTARNRSGFAHGAVLAAEWLIGKTGFFTMRDMIQAYLLA